MPISTQYRTLYGVDLPDHTESYAGNEYNKILVENYLDLDTSETTSTNSNGGEIEFIWPKSHYNTYWLDGQLTGHFKFISNAASKSVTSYTFRVKLRDGGGTETDVGVISESALTISKDQDEICAIPIFLDLEKVEVAPNDRLIIAFSITGNTSSLSFLHYNDNNFEDLKINLPMAPIRGR